MYSKRLGMAVAVTVMLLASAKQPAGNTPDYNALNYSEQSATPLECGEIAVDWLYADTNPYVKDYGNWPCGPTMARFDKRGSVYVGGYGPLQKLQEKSCQENYPGTKPDWKAARALACSNFDNHGKIASRISWAVMCKLPDGSLPACAKTSS